MTTPFRVGLGRCSSVSWNTTCNVDFNLDDDDDSHPDENDNEDSDDYTDDSYIVMTRMIIVRAMMIMIKKEMTKITARMILTKRLVLPQQKSG